MADKKLTQEQIKPFHELTEAEFMETIEGKMTWDECAKKYPQPSWCRYPDAVMGLMGCWSLTSFMVTGEDYCKNCDYYMGNEEHQAKSVAGEI